jgi:hypothetical protein
MRFGHERLDAPTRLQFSQFDRISESATEEQTATRWKGRTSDLHRKNEARDTNAAVPARNEGYGTAS